MKSTIKVALASLLLVPVLASAVTVFTPFSEPAFAQTGGIRDGADQARDDTQPTELFGDTGVFTRIINVILFIIGMLSVLMLVIGGIRYTISAGNPDQVKGAKNTIMYAIIGVVVALLAYAIVNFVLVALV